MKYTLFALFLFNCSIQQVFASNNPTILLYERNPWLIVIGSDSPTFALYDDGTVIYCEESADNRGTYKTTKLSKKEIETQFLSPLNTLENLEESYSLSDWTDQPTQELHLSTDSRTRVINIYGNLRNDEEVREKAPKEFLTYYDHLIGYRSDSATNWEPTHIEVMIWPYAYAPDESIVWPKEWPDINSESTTQRGESFSIYLPIEYKDKFLKFIGTRKEKGAVLINGKKWAVSTRLPFPHEMHLTSH